MIQRFIDRFFRDKFGELNFGIFFFIGSFIINIILVIVIIVVVGKNTSLQNNFNNKVNDFNSLQTKSQEAIDNYDKVTKENEDLNDEISSLNSNILEYQESIDSLTKDNSTLEDNLATITKDKENLQSNFDNLYQIIINHGYSDVLKEYNEKEVKDYEENLETEPIDGDFDFQNEELTDSNSQDDIEEDIDNTEEDSLE